jgi:hypothetical protein
LAWWRISIIPALKRKLRQENGSLGYITDHVSKNKQKQHKKNYNHVTLVRLQNDPNPIQNSF